jgi:tight adherence protein B
VNPVIGFLLALLAAYGAFLLYTSLVLGWRGLGPTARPARRANQRQRLADFLVQAGLDRIGVGEFLAVAAVLFVVGALVAWALFGGVLPPLAVGGAAAGFPIASARARRARRLDQARDSWPRLIEELRIQAVSLGRSIPQALFVVGRRAPTEMQPAFEAAHREWLISTDFDRTLAVLKAALADPTADAVCETLLIAHEVGGTDVDRRLAALLEDRILDLQGRKDARAKQAGARFARNFVLVVPLGMALVGQSIAEGRGAYGTPGAQVAIVVALGVIAACWLWAARLMRLPEEERVFHGVGGDGAGAGGAVRDGAGAA